MYHLLINSEGWLGEKGTMPNSRVFEYTNPEICEKFKSGNEFNIQQIASIPAIFASEINSAGVQDVCVGRITNVTQSDDKIHIEYYLDKDILGFSRLSLENLTNELEIENFELYRTHWAIKNIDLFKILFKKLTNKPKVFRLEYLRSSKTHLIGVMMPFDQKFSDVYQVINEVSDHFKIECLRADNIWEHSHVIQDIVSLINSANIIIADCTGKNANVFYEVGIAHTIGREVILITQKEEDIPFDLRHLRYISYLNNAEGREELSKALKSKITQLI
ncbi:TPA: hypothetical protein ACF74P_003023 [Legionella pneumophila]|nr:hypothetical protein [Legionella pneumophila]HEN5551955.1 hypothetical protein [Legionella pneumophila]HEN5557819.1 hypothetical protein [Legionella pneumophila]